MSELTVICGRCKRPITPGTGFLAVSLREIREYQAAEEAWQARHQGEAHSLQDLMTLPDEVPWRARHHACAPKADSDAYEISTDRLVSWRDLTWWTAHLMAKSWLEVTDWDELLRETADGEGTRIVAQRQDAA